MPLYFSHEWVKVLIWCIVTVWNYAKYTSTDIIQEQSLFLQEPLTVYTYLHTAFFRITMCIINTMFLLTLSATAALRAYVNDFVLIFVQITQVCYPIILFA